MNEKVEAKPVFAGRLLVRNTVLNLAGQVLPALCAIVSMPALIHRLGSERFGILMLAWMSIGYFNIFDFGLGRALTRAVAARLGTPSEGEIPRFFWSTLISTGLLGIVGAVVLVRSGHFLAANVFKVPVSLILETEQSLWIIAGCLPFVIMAASTRGYLEATQDFIKINFIQIPLGIGFYLLPLLVCFFTTSVPVIIAALVLLRVCVWFAYVVASMRTPNLAGKGIQFESSVLPELLKFGGWIAFSNLVIPAIAYADRFLVGMLLSLSAVTYYSTPYELINRLWVIPFALMSVVFPALTSELVASPVRAARLYFRANKVLFAVFAPLAVVVILLAPWGLGVWVGAEIAAQSAEVMQILMIAMFINIFGLAPTAMLDALGKPAVTAISHVVQFPIYVAALWFLIPKYGLRGAAIIWVVRNLVDTLTLAYFAEKNFKAAAINWRRVLIFGFGSIVVFVMVGWLPIAFGWRALVALAYVVLFFPWIWLRLFTSEERTEIAELILGKLARIPSKSSVSAPTRATVGIALAAYKPEIPFFIAQLESIRTQGYRDWICVISFDSEIPDDERLAVYKSDEQFVWVRNSAAPGVKTNFENAVRVCLDLQVDTVAFSDQDDIWYPEKLGRLMTELKKIEGLGMVHSDMHLFATDAELADKSKLRISWPLEPRIVDGYTPYRLMLRNVVTGAASLFDAEIARRALDIPAAAEMHDHWYAMIASLIGEVRPVHEALYAYRQHGNNVLGFIAYDGLTRKPKNVSWFDGIRKSVASYERSVKTFATLKLRGLTGEVAPLYGKIFRNGLLGPVVLFLTSFLYVKDDPALGRASLFKAIGGTLRLFGVKPFEKKP